MQNSANRLRLSNSQASIPMFKKLNIDKDWILTYLLGIIIGVVRSVKYLYSSLHRLTYHIVIFKRSLYQYGITFDSVKNYSMLIVTRKILTKMQSIQNYYLIRI